MEELTKEELSIHEKLLAIQTNLKAPKDLFNTFGKYKYRSLESILEAVKPYLKEYKCTLKLKDEIVQIGERFYVKNTAILSDGKEEITNSAFAREAEKKSGMDEAQITGSSSTYARKYCLNGLFAIDDTKDADTDEQAYYIKGKQNIEEKEKTKNVKKEKITDEQKTTKINQLLKLYKKLSGKDMQEVNIEDLNEKYNFIALEYKKAFIEKFSKMATQEELEKISNFSIDKQYNFLTKYSNKGE